MTWISFGALPCRKKKNWWQLASWCCWNRECSCHVSELVSVLVRPRTYQDSGISFRFGSLTIIVYFLITTAFRKLDPFPSSGEEFSGVLHPRRKCAINHWIISSDTVREKTISCSLRHESHYILKKLTLFISPDFFKRTNHSVLLPHSGPDTGVLISP